MLTPAGEVTYNRLLPVDSPYTFCFGHGEPYFWSLILLI